jgi:predicted metal-dependent RNase
MSAHAEREELLAYTVARKPKTVIITHGDPPARVWFAESLGRLKDAPRVIDPVPGDVINV